MGEHKVLVTTSGIGSRLGTITDFTNKCLVRVGDKPSISHIIESYPSGTPFVITLGHFGHLVRQFLELTYPEIKFEFIEIDNYSGPGSSLGYSILQAKEKLQCPFIFHASDTILGEGDRVPFPDDNWCAGAIKEDSSQYRTFTVNGDLTGNINEKGEINFDYAYIGLCGIKDYKNFWNILEKTYKENPNNSSLSDVHVINGMMSKADFRFVKVDKWLDIGNTSELAKTRKEFQGEYEILDKEEESIYFYDEFVVKFFSNTTINKNRVTRGINLHPLVPKIIDHSDNFYKYKKTDGQLMSKCVTVPMFLEFLEWAEANLWHPKSEDKFSERCEAFYLDKTKSRVEKYLNGKDDKTCTINGIEVDPVVSLIDKIDKDWLCAGTPVQFHGDFILDNVLKTPDGFCLLDWRQDFGGNLETGDIYYDLAKLNHNLTVNHGIVESGHYGACISNCYILCNTTLSECQKLLHEFIIEKGYDLQKVKILTSLIWINMSPLHEYPFSKFLFNFGKYNLHQNLRDKK